MKRFITLFIAVLGTAAISFSISSCEGPTGPPGIPGPPGADGLIGSVFEVQIDFRPGNDWIEFVEIPNSIEVFDTDVIVAYTLLEVQNGLDVWEPLPQTLFLGNEILLYGYDYTLADVKFFLDGTVNLANLDPDFTDGIIFRVAVIPADFAQSIDLNKMEDVMQALNIEEVSRLQISN
jgi:hypothetical protein